MLTCVMLVYLQTFLFYRRTIIYKLLAHEILFCISPLLVTTDNKFCYVCCNRPYQWCM